MKPTFGFIKVAAALALILSFSSQDLGSARADGSQSAAPNLAQSSETPVVADAPVTPREFRGDLRNLPQIQPANLTEQQRPSHLSPQLKMPLSSSLNGPQSPAQTQMPQLSMPAPLTNFNGLDLASWGSGWPPDPNGDVGPNHFIEAVNTSIGIFNKSGVLLTAFTYNSFWSGAGTGTACDTNNQGDPIVLYDASADRWLFMDMAWTNIMGGPYYECFAISKTSDPVSGGWWQYAVRTDQTGQTYLADYPKLAVWPDGIYMSANMFDCLNSSCSSAFFEGARTWVFNRSQMESGAVLQSYRADTNSNYFTLLPSNLRGSAPPSGTPDYFVALDQFSNNLDIWKFHVDWVTPANNTFTGPFSVPIASFAFAPASIPELGGENIDSIGDRLMMQNQYRNIGGAESLWLTHTVTSGSVTGVRWYQLNVSGGVLPLSPVQSGTFQPDNKFRWLPSLAVDRAGNMAIGYSVSSGTMYPAIAYSGRLATDPLNTLGQGEVTLIAGTGAQNSGFNRWGDYSAMTVDPTNDCTFWYTNEYYVASGSDWHTRIGSFRFPSCSTFIDVPTTYWAWQYIESIYDDGITGGCETSPQILYCPDNPVTRAQMAVFLLRSIHGSSYTPPAPTGPTFSDVPGSYWAANWIDELAAEGITSGCGGGNYCPDLPVTRAQMAMFLLRGEHGASYTPPSATGTLFKDVSASYWDAGWIEQLANEGITSGCGGGNFCPEASVTRAQEAVFLIRTFHLPLH